MANKNKYNCTQIKTTLVIMPKTRVAHSESPKTKIKQNNNTKCKQFTTNKIDLLTGMLGFVTAIF